MKEPYICLEHNHSACPECVKDFRKIEQERDSLQEQVKELEAPHARYEQVRKFTPKQFLQVYIANLHGNGSFDELIDRFRLATK